MNHCKLIKIHFWIRRQLRSAWLRRHALRYCNRSALFPMALTPLASLQVRVKEQAEDWIYVFPRLEWGLEMNARTSLRKLWFQGPCARTLFLPHISSDLPRSQIYILCNNAKCQKSLWRGKNRRRDHTLFFHARPEPYSHTVGSRRPLTCCIFQST